LSESVTATLSEVSESGSVTEVGGEIVEVDSCSLKVGFTDDLLKKA